MPAAVSHLFDFMTFESSLFVFDGYLNFPNSPLGWGIFGGFCLLLIFLAWRFRRYSPPRTGMRWLLFISLVLITPVTSLFSIIQMPPGTALPPPGTPLLPEGPVLLLFSALPWTLAAGFLGPFATGLLAGLSGGIIAFFNGHNPFMPLSYALIGILLSTATRQRFRTLVYRIISRPLIATIALSILYIFLFGFTTLFVVEGTLPVRLDYAFSHMLGASLAFFGQMLIGALFAEVIAIGWPGVWYGDGSLEPSPAERSLESRLLYGLVPLVLALVVLLMVGDWYVANTTTRSMLETQMQTTAITAANSLPFFLETGQNLIAQIAQDERLTSNDQDELVDTLIEHLRKEPFFSQFTLLDSKGESLAGFPVADFDKTFPTPDELLGVNLAMNGVAFQQYSLPPEGNDTAAQLVFITTIQANDEAPVQGILLGYTKLNENPFTKPIIENLETLTDVQGEGMIVDEEGMILYHPDKNQVGNYLEIETGNEPIFEPNVTAPDGTRQMLYIYPVPGRSWVTVTVIPAEYAQQVALENAAPLLSLMLLMATIGYLVIRLGLRMITSSIQKLAFESEKIAEGDLDHKVVSKNADEIGQLGQALEQMRISLKTRMDEVNRLLFVSRGVASALEMDLAVKPILKGALATGASSARLILTPAALPETDQEVQSRFGLGPSAEKYQGLDEKILAMTESEHEVVMDDPQGAGLENESGGPIPASLLAIALRHENVHYGTLWIAYDQPHTFFQDEVRFLSAIAGQAALAAANARLYLSEQLGRQRFEAILASTPDPVLVTDHQNRFLVANPAAITLLGDGEMPTSGTAIDKVIEQEELLNLLQEAEISDTPRSVEVNFPGNRTYHATASPVMADGQMMGRVCVLTDVTQFKELDALKSEFVSTVSHDLRSPLTLMRGYATMLQMVGELNEQQAGYINKIVSGIESMSFLINNLLDLGRIEAGVGLQLDKVPVEEITRQVIEGLHVQAIQKQIDLTFEPSPGNSPLIEADQALLHQAIYNLVDNAIKYTDAGGKVTVSIKVKPSEIAWVVQDTGIGISPLDLPRVFERFFRPAGRRSSQHKGSGLGLTIVKSIAEHHGGSVKAESQLGKGSTFTLTIPMRQVNESKE